MSNGLCFRLTDIGSSHRGGTVINDQEKKFGLLVGSEFALIDKGEFTERFSYLKFLIEMVQC